MHRLYEDLTKRLGKPLWYDEQAVPRYDEFHPSMLGIYDDWALLYEIACQACGERFIVAASLSTAFAQMNELRGFEWEQRESPDHILPLLEDSFGDAPWHGEHQCSGTTMSSDFIRPLQLWARPAFKGWDLVQSWEGEA